MRKFWIDTNEPDTFTEWSPHIFARPTFESGEEALPDGIIECPLDHPCKVGFNVLTHRLGNFALDTLPTLLAIPAPEIAENQAIKDFEDEEVFKIFEIIYASQRIAEHEDNYAGAELTEADWRTYRNVLRDYTVLPRPVRPS